jgi:hypothetical protein
MSEILLSLSHSKWDCKYHCVRAQATTESHLRPSVANSGNFQSAGLQKERQIMRGNLNT